MFTIDETDWGAVDEITGIGAVLPEIFAENRGDGDGQYITGQRIAARDIGVTAQVMDARRNVELRRSAVSFFNPKREYRAYVSYQGATLWLPVRLAGVNLPAQQIDLPQRLTFDLLAADPFWRSETTTERTIQTEVPMWYAPLFIDVFDPATGQTTDRVVSYRVSNGTETFAYFGDVPGWLSVTITATGAVTNPQISTDRGFVAVLDELVAGDVLTMDFEHGRIAKNGANIIKKLDRSSNLNAMQMLPGDNAVSYTADAGEGNMEVDLTWFDRFLGV